MVVVYCVLYAVPYDVNLELGLGSLVVSRLSNIAASDHQTRRKKVYIKRS